MDITYFAYGSNMNLGQMEQRCPGAKVLSTGELDKFRFIINERGYATIIPDEGSAVYGVVWQISKNHEKRLDEYEGVDRGLYEKEYHTINTETESYSSLVYIASDREKGKPKPGYIEGVIKGAESNSLPQDYIDKYLKQWIEEQ
ncbi:gamma-glutamylcyclotransferase family protein [Planctomycetota bacterium]